MEDNNTSSKKPMVIDVPEILQILKERKRYFYVTLPLAFIIGAVIMWSTPKYYACQVRLAPETTTTANALSSLASSFGLKIANQMNEDAIVPEFYPDVVNSTDFMVDLFNVHVTTDDGKVSTTYYDYLDNYQKSPWWNNIGKAVGSLFSSDDDDAPEVFDPFRLTRKQTSMMRAISHSVACAVDKKTDVITIYVEDTDPLICATLADSIRQKLQDFITAYRTNKARNDLEYLQDMRQQVYEQYQLAQENFTRFVDSNHDLFTAHDKAHRDNLEQEMDLLANSYTNLCTQIQLNEAKVQAKTPAFTTLQSASVPNRPAGPKRTVTVLLILLATFVTTVIFAVVKAQLDKK